MGRRKIKAKKAKSGPVPEGFIYKEGDGPEHRLIVIRPRDPVLALRLAKQCVGKDNDHAFQQVLAAQPYEERGYAWNDPAQKKIMIADADGNLLEETKEGDSFVLRRAPPPAPRTEAPN